MESKVIWKRRMSILAVVAGVLMMYFWFALVSQPPLWDCPTGASLDPTPPSAIGDPANGCRPTIFDGRGKPAPERAYGYGGTPYPGPRPLTLRSDSVIAAAFFTAVGLLFFGIRGIVATKDRDRERVERRSSRVWGRTLITGGALLCVWWTLVVVGTLMRFYPSFINQTWPLLGEPSIGRLSMLPIATGMLAAGLAIVTRRPAWRSFGIGFVFGAVELLLVTYLIVAAFGPMFDRPLTQNTPSRLGVVVLNAWIILGAAVAVGSAAAWVAANRGRRWQRWGLVGVPGVAAVSLVLLVGGWLPFAYWELPGSSPFG